MNADEVLRALKECGDCDNCPYYSCWIDKETGDPVDACNDGRLFKDILSLIESLQAQLAEAKRRERAAVEDLRCACWNDDEICGGKLCVYCAKFNKFDAKKPWPCDKPCKDACEWQWRGDAEEDAE